jgi:hypothetical protein
MNMQNTVWLVFTQAHAHHNSTCAFLGGGFEPDAWECRLAYPDQAKGQSTRVCPCDTIRRQYPFTVLFSWAIYHSLPHRANVARNQLFFCSTVDRR